MLQGVKRFIPSGSDNKQHIITLARTIKLFSAEDESICDFVYKITSAEVGLSEHVSVVLLTMLVFVVCASLT